MNIMIITIMMMMMMMIYIICTHYEIRRFRNWKDADTDADADGKVYCAEAEEEGGRNSHSLLLLL